MVRLYEQVTPNLKLAGRIVGQGTLWCARQLLKTRELMPVSPMEAVSLGGTVMVFSYLGLFNLDSDKELTPRHLLWTMVIVAPTLILSNLYEIRDLFRNP
ncbi:hypothetical protein [Parendozoicomonas haliclonae]|nr:hypothetical protein [Parendozoicomonas haliclonae]